MPPPITNVPAGPWAASTTPTYTATIVDQNQNPVPASALSTLTLSIVDTLTGLTINGVRQVNILNADRGSVDGQGNLTIRLQVGDTSMDETTAPSVQRSLIIDFSYNGGLSVGRHEATFELVALSGL